MSLTYNQYVAEMLVLTQFNAGDPEFTTNLPNALDYAQDRIDRELNLLNTVASNSSLALTPGSRSLDITAASINVLSDVNVITPSGTTNPDLGTRNPCTPSTKEWMNAVFGSVAVAGTPQYFAMLTNSTILFAPWPDLPYQIELVGTVRPQSLSASNPATWVSTNLPDLLLAASMIFMSGFMKNFGAQSDDPKSAVSWESQYVTLRDSATVEDARRKFQAAGWTSDMPSALNPPRT